MLQRPPCLMSLSWNREMMKMPNSAWRSRLISIISIDYYCLSYELYYELLLISIISINYLFEIVMKVWLLLLLLLLLPLLVRLYVYYY